MSSQDFEDKFPDKEKFLDKLFQMMAERAIMDDEFYKEIEQRLNIPNINWNEEYVNHIMKICEENDENKKNRNRGFSL